MVEARRPDFKFVQVWKVTPMGPESHLSHHHSAACERFGNSSIVSRAGGGTCALPLSSHPDEVDSTIEFGISRPSRASVQATRA